MRSKLIAPLVALLALLAHSTASSAPPRYDGVKQAETRFGTLSIDEKDWDAEVSVIRLDGRVQIPDAPGMDGSLHIMDVFEMDRDTDIALVQFASRASACPGSFYLYAIDRRGVREIDGFTTCSDVVADIRFEPGHLEIDLPTVEPGIVHETFIWDGSKLSSLAVRAHEFGAEMAGAGQDVTRWIGAHPASMLSEPGERLRFKQIMTESEFHDFEQALRVGSATQQVGDFVIGDGFNNLFEYSAAWAIRIQDGRPFVVLRKNLYADEPDTRVFGGDFHELPRPLRVFATREWPSLGSIYD